MEKITKDELIKLVPKKHLNNFKSPKNFESIDWSDTDFLGWIHPSGHLGYILEDLTSKHRLWVFTCSNKSTPSRRARMCSICLSIHGNINPSVKIFSSQHFTQKKLSRGQFICGDLNCNKWVRIINSNTMRESLSFEEKRLRILINLELFLSSFI